MAIHKDKTQEHRNQSISKSEAQAQIGNGTSWGFADHRPENAKQLAIQQLANISPRAIQMRTIRDNAINSKQAQQVAQLQSISSNTPSIQLMSKTQAAALDPFDYGSGDIHFIEDTRTRDEERLRIFIWNADPDSTQRNLEVHWHGDVYDSTRINVRWEDDEASRGREIPDNLLTIFRVAIEQFE